MNWIKVSDKLPCKNKKVLTYTKDIVKGSEYRLIMTCSAVGILPPSVTHWMDLPEAPND